MMRPTNWSPLATTDPVPGDPVQLSAIARRHAELAEELSAQAHNLRTLASSDGWDADAGRLFVSSATDVADQLDGAEVRYHAVADALNGYVPYLEQAQREADAALADAQAAHVTMANCQPVATPAPPAAGPVDRWAADPWGLDPAVDPWALDPWAADPAVETARRERALHEASADLSGARQRLRNAEDLRLQQARRAASRIRDAISHGDLVDSWWDKVKDWSGDRWDGLMKWTRDHACQLEEIAKICGKISSALSKVATVVAVLTPFLPFLAPLDGILFWAIATTTGVALGCNLLLALSGEPKWANVGFGVVDLVTAGYGRKLRTGTKFAQQALEKTVKRSTRKSAEAVARKAMRESGQGPLTGQAAARATRAMLRKVRADAAKGFKKASKVSWSEKAAEWRTLDLKLAKELAKAKKLANLAGTAKAAKQAADVEAAIRKEVPVALAKKVNKVAKKVHKYFSDDSDSTCRVSSP